MITFDWWWVVFLLPLPLLIMALLPASRHRDAALQVPHLPDFANDASATRSFRLGNVLGPWLIWLLFLLALARPQWLGDPVTLPVTGRDLMLAVDVSGSMGQEDLRLRGKKTTRLEVVKDVVGNFVSRRKGDRIGLILFGTYAYLQAPLTFDRNTVQQLLNEAFLGIAGGKTAIGDAIGLAIKRLRNKPENDRVLILLTDGASNVGEVTPLKASELALREGVRIHTIGVGASEMARPGIFGLSLGLSRFNPSVDLDEETLTQIATNTGGQYFRAESTDELEGIYQLLDKLEPVEQPEETYRPVKQLYPWPLAVALLFSLGMAIWFLHSDLQRQRQLERAR